MAVVLGLPAPAAQASGECGEWQLFPDFTCDEFQGRRSGTVNPVGMPYLFEDPHTTTGLNFAYLYHGFPTKSVMGGGEAHILALQARLAITRRLSFIATKDGLVILRPGNRNPTIRGLGVQELLHDETSGADITVGFKYALVDDRERDFILSPALRYEIPIGSSRVFQGYGDGVLIPSASMGWGLGALGAEAMNVVASLGGQVPMDSNANSESLFYNLHVNYVHELDGSFFEAVAPFIEVNGMHWTKGGNGKNQVNTKLPAASPLTPVTIGASQALLGTSYEGNDYANLGAPSVGGNDVVTLGGGLRVPTAAGVSFAAMYEAPVSDRKDIFGKRFTFMATWEY